MHRRSREPLVRSWTPGERAWSAWALALFVGVCAAMWPLVVLAPSRSFARAVVRAGARAMLLLARVPVAVRGLEHLRRCEGPLVLVSNHTSEVDVVAIAASLPPRFGFIAKSELRRIGWLRWPLQRIGTVFVERGRAASEGPSQTDLATSRLRAGNALLFFPEGTFRRDGPGVLPFHRGAFVAAARARVPVVPIAIRGARWMTPVEGELRFRRGAVQVDIGAPLRPRTDVDPEVDALALRHAARAFILARTGEPDRRR